MAYKPTWVDFEVKVVERVERTYLVQIPVHKREDEETLKAQAEEKLYSGEYVKFTDTNADIEEILSVERQS
jgi:hypothetical protein